MNFYKNKQLEGRERRKASTGWAFITFIGPLAGFAFGAGASGAGFSFAWTFVGVWGLCILVGITAISSSRNDRAERLKNQDR